MMMHDDDITNKILLEHIQAIAGNQHVMSGRLDKLEGKFEKLEGRFDRLEKKVDSLSIEIQSTKIYLSNQIAEIDSRLDAIEFASLPARMKKVEEAVFTS